MICAQKLSVSIVVGILFFFAFAWRALADSNQAWDPTTSGPFYTGTAETVPPGSFFVETYLFDEEQPGLGTRSFDVPLRFDVGLANGMDLSGLIPYDYTLQENNAGTWVHGGGIGDSQFWMKKELVKASSKWPAISAEFVVTLPSGNSAYLKPNLYSADQTGLGTTDVGISLLARKRMRPCEFYGQVTYSVASEAQVSPGYVTTNGITLPQGGVVAPGDTITYAAAFERVLNEATEFGYLIEFYGMTSTGQNMFRGPTGQNWSFVDAAPELEINSSKNTSWGVGEMIPVYQYNYPKTDITMFTVTYSYSGPEGHR